MPLLKLEEALVGIAGCTAEPEGDFISVLYLAVIGLVEEDDGFDLERKCEAAELGAR